MTEQDSSKLTIDDPIDGDTLKRFEELQTLRMQFSDRLLDLEQEKIKVLRAATGLDMERQKLFESVLVTRGLPPTHPVEIDAKTGLIKLLKPLDPPVESEPTSEPISASSNGVEVTA